MKKVSRSGLALITSQFIVTHRLDRHYYLLPPANHATNTVLQRVQDLSAIGAFRMLLDPVDYAALVVEVVTASLHCGLIVKANAALVCHGEAIVGVGPGIPLSNIASGNSFCISGWRPVETDS